MRRRAPGVAVVAALWVLAALVGGAGCGTVGAFVDLEQELSTAGFRNISVDIDSGSGVDSLRISAAAPAALGVEAAQSKAAEITWKTFNRRFERLTVSISGTSRTFARAELEQQFGPRPAGLDDKDLGDELRSIGIGVLIALVVGGILCVGLIVLVLVLVSRSRRKKRSAVQQQQWAGQPPWGGPGPGSHPGAPGPPGYPPAPGPPGYPVPPQPQPQPPPSAPQQAPPGWS